MIQTTLDRFVTSGGSEEITRLGSLGNTFLYGVTNVLLGSRFTDLCYGYNAFWRHLVPQLGLPDHLLLAERSRAGGAGSRSAGRAMLDRSQTLDADVVRHLAWAPRRSGFRRRAERATASARSSSEHRPRRVVNRGSPSGGGAMTVRLTWFTVVHAAS